MPELWDCLHTLIGVKEVDEILFRKARQTLFRTGRFLNFEGVLVFIEGKTVPPRGRLIIIHSTGAGGKAGH